MVVPGHLKNRASTAQIFLIDDEPVVVEAHIAYLRNAGFHNLHGFTAVDEAIRLLRCLRPDLILTDIHMPGTSGCALTGLLREFEHLESMPIVAVTADICATTTENVLGLGADAVLLKPVTEDELVGLVSSYIFSTAASVE